MKVRIKILFGIIFLMNPAWAQVPQNDSLLSRFQVSLGYDRDFFINGYVQVRENQFDGTHLSLHHDLGMKTWSNISLELSYTFRNRSSIRALFEYFFFYGNSILDNNIWFNATNLNGQNGVSIGKTQLFESRIFWIKPVRLIPDVQTSLILGLLYDGLYFRINGDTLSGSPRNEAHEDFISQALPFPEIGFLLRKLIRQRSSVSLEATGTYIPLFKSFFLEGGHMFLHYYSVSSDLGYKYSPKHFFINPSIQFRTFRTYENSGEDTNDFYIISVGIKLKIGFGF
jgi:hypothetical protein